MMAAFIITIDYRLATLDDASMLQQFIQNGFRASDTRANWTGDATKVLNDTFTISLAAINKTIESKESAFVIAHTENPGPGHLGSPCVDLSEHEAGIQKSKEDIVACFCLTHKSADLASFAWFVVAQPYQQGGNGRKVLAYAEKYVREKWPEVTKLELNALSTRDELIKWYERCGYVKNGHTDPFPKEFTRGVELPEGLCFVFLEKSLV